MLSAVDVRKRFKGLSALADARIDVGEGEIVGLVGPNGSGKTTFLNCLSGFIRPDEGRIELRGKRIDRLPASTLARLGVGRTFQAPQLPSRMTVLETMLCAAHLPVGYSVFGSFLRPAKVREEEKRATARAMEVLEGVGLPNAPGAAATSLSGGQQKLLGLALMLMERPSLLMLDEPTAGVNPSLRRSIVDLLKGLRSEHGISMLLIEHDMEFVQNLCDRVFVLDKGSIVAECKPSELADDPRVVEAYLGKRRPDPEKPCGIDSDVTVAGDRE